MCEGEVQGEEEVKWRKKGGWGGRGQGEGEVKGRKRSRGRLLGGCLGVPGCLAPPYLVQPLSSSPNPNPNPSAQGHALPRNPPHRGRRRQAGRDQGRAPGPTHVGRLADPQPAVRGRRDAPVVVRKQRAEPQFRRRVVQGARPRAGMRGARKWQSLAGFFALKWGVFLGCKMPRNTPPNL